MANNSDDWGSKEAKTITNAKYISGTPNKGNLDKWDTPPRQHSSHQSEPKRQSKADLAPVTKGESINLDPSDDWGIKDYQPKGWVVTNETARRNSFPSKRGK